MLYLSIFISYLFFAFYTSRRKLTVALTEVLSYNFVIST